MLEIPEKILRDGIVNHMEANRLIMVGHKHSCLTNLTSLLDKAIGGIDRGERVEACSLDFQKACYSANHKLLDQKVKAFGMDAKVHNWISEV